METTDECGIKLIPHKQIIPPKDGWKENTFYLVEVAHNKHNPVHKAICYSGFSNGGYRHVYHPSYNSEIYDERDWYYVKVLKELDINLEDD